MERSDDTTPSKLCPSCKQVIAISLFKRRPDGTPQSWCRSCTNASSRQWEIRNPTRRAEARKRLAEKNPERNAEKTRRYRAKHPDRARDSVYQWRKDNPERLRLIHKGYYAVKVAIKQGVLTRPLACEKCGVTGVRIESAHYDYSRLLDVRWLCHSCHMQWDVRDPKTLH